MNNYNDEGVSTMSNALKWGVYAAGALIVFDLILYLLGLKDPSGKSPIMYLGFLIFIVMVVMAVKEYKTSNGTMSLGQAIGTGTLTGLIAGVIVGIWVYIFATFIDPGFLELIRETARDQMLADGMSEEQYETARGMMETFTSPGVMGVMSIFSYSLIGFIVSLITGLVKKS